VKAKILEQLRDGGYPLTAKFIHPLYKLARKLAAKYNVPQDYEDLCQISIAQAISLEPLFNPDKGANFFTFIQRPILQAAQRTYGYERATTRLYNKVLKFIETHEKETGFIPHTAEIAKALKTTTVNIESLFYGRPQKISLDLLGDHEVTTEYLLHPNPEVHSVLEGLNESDRLLVSRYFLEEYSTYELAKAYHTTVPEITKRINGILEQLKEQYA